MRRTSLVRFGNSFPARFGGVCPLPVLAAVAVLALLTGSVLAQTSGLSPSDRSFIEEHFRAAKNFEASQKYDQAANEYELILSKYPAAVPRVYQNLGLTYYLRGKYDDAVKTFEKGLRMAPEMIGARLLLGRCYLLMEQPEKALPHLKQAHQQQPTLESATYLGQAYSTHLEYEPAIEYYRKALALTNKEQEDNVIYLIGKSYTKRAERIVNRQTGLHPESKDTHLAAAKIFDLQDGYQVAAIKYLEAAELDPMNASLFYPLARLLAILDLDEASRIALDRYHQLMPHDQGAIIDETALPKQAVAKIGTEVDFAGILRSLPAVDRESLPPFPMLSSDVNDALRQELAADSTGRWKSMVAHLAAGRYKEGVAVLNSIRGRKHAWLNDYLDAVVNSWLENYKAAEEAANRRNLKRSPLQVVQMLRAEIYHKLTLVYLSRLLEQHPDSCLSHFVRGQNLAGQEKRQAEEEFKAAIAKCPEKTQIRIALAEHYLSNSRYDEALEQCLKELEFNPYSSATKKHIGRIYVQLRDAEKGIPVLLEALEADPQDANARMDLGRGYELVEEWDMAIEQYNLALKLEPSLNRVHYVLGRIYRQLGQTELARQQYKLFRENQSREHEEHIDRIQRLRKREAKPQHERP